ncbi:MAG: 50S ribosomal protein L30 [Pseudomonadota bacterium]
MSSKSEIKILQIKSTIGASKSQIATIKGLGLKGIGSSRVLVLTSSIAGMIKKVAHLIKVV